MFLLINTGILISSQNLFAAYIIKIYFQFKKNFHKFYNSVMKRNNEKNKNYSIIKKIKIFKIK